MDPANGMQYVPTYEDKDGDWMLVGDVPWKYVRSFKNCLVVPQNNYIFFLLKKKNQICLISLTSFSFRGR